MKRLVCAVGASCILVSPAVAQNPPEEEEPATASSTALGDSFGNAPGGIHAGALSIRLMLQTRYTYTNAEKSTSPYVLYGDPLPGLKYSVREDYLAHNGDGWTLNRFFLRLAADPTPRLGFKTILDFAELQNNPANVVKQAYGEVRPIPRRLEFTAGIFKIPFSILELDPIAQYELAHLGHADELIKDLGFGGRDVGAQVKIAPLPKRKWLQLYLGAFQGNARNENASPVGAIGARAESKPAKFLRLGVSFTGRPDREDYLRPFKSSKKDDLAPVNPEQPMSCSSAGSCSAARHLGKGKAWEADVTFEALGFMARAEGMMGDRVDLDTRYDAQTWWAAWGLVAYQFSVGPFDLMPAVRVEWLDADRQHSFGLRKTISGGVMLLFSKDIRLLFDITRTSVQPGSPLVDQPKPLPVPDGVMGDSLIHPYMDLGSTKGVVQLQLML